MADRAGTKIVEPKNVKIDNPVVRDTRRHPEESEKRAKPSVVPYHPGRDPPESRCNLSVDLCKNSGTFLKMPEELLLVNFIVVSLMFFADL